MLLDPQVGAVGVGADDPERPLAAQSEFQATSEPARTVKYRPGSSGQRSASRSSVYPAAPSRAATVAQT